MKHILAAIISAVALGVIISTSVLAANSPDGSKLRFSDPAGSSLVDNSGTWTFGTVNDGYGNYPILLNGAPAGSAKGSLMQMDSGKVKVQASDLSWWGYSLTVSWQSATAPPVTQVMTDTPPSATQTTVVPGVAAGNAWILNNFTTARQYTGTFHGVADLVFPSLVKNATCTGGYYCFRTFDLNYDTVPPSGGQGPNGTASTDQRSAFVNTTVSNQIVDGMYAAGIYTSGNGSGWISHMLAFLSNVTVTPNLPAWQSYSVTNFDGITFDGGWPDGKVYLEDVTMNGWSDAALDVKGQQLQAVRLKTNGGGINTLKVWQSGPHYIVDSVINNSRWLDPNAVLPSDDGGLVSTMDCTKTEIRIWNSTFNGSTTLARNRVRCFYTGTPADMKIKYLSIDPRRTGEMHPMFVAPQ